MSDVDVQTLDVQTLMSVLREHPVPLEHICELRDRVVTQTDERNFLFGVCRDPEEDGSTLQDPELARMLTGVALGQWPMSVAAVDAWVARLLERRPACVLEFGSGVSTVVSATILRRVHGDGRVRVYSVEQGHDAGAETRARLEAHDLQGLVSMHIAPVEAVTVDAFSGPGYSITIDQMAEFLGEARPEMVLVDGPFGKYGARFSTLPVARPWLATDAEIWMDDALRDSELAIARWWAALGYLTAPQVQWSAKGILRGQRGASPRHYADAARAMAAGEMTDEVAEYALFKLRVQAAQSVAQGLQPPFRVD